MHDITSLKGFVKDSTVTSCLTAWESFQFVLSLREEKMEWLPHSLIRQIWAEHCECSLNAWKVTARRQAPRFSKRCFITSSLAPGKYQDTCSLVRTGGKMESAFS